MRFYASIEVGSQAGALVVLETVRGHGEINQSIRSKNESPHRISI